ncbi:related to CYC3-holocytochrome-c synthase (cytochrome c heme lyase) [Sporisorium reilianum f. sp. reilianum]|uniref:Holocytochrome c-type synthase n=1 Tax=Sporisorium reilianum f. sp. reilianum TaxID=72559 RepID=A0A2N8U8Z8_9BASI|nr:related to CYC3-holocytochrome-c synthase (cytochrome c heme lyase) [Sporisorium reilianum f. sp. reilianum]
MNPAEIVRAIRAQAASEQNPNTDNQHAVAALMAYKLNQHRDEILRSMSAGSSSAAASPSASSSTPPPGCPMHASGSSAPPAPPKPSPPKMVASSGGQCPIPHEDRDKYLASKSAPSASSSGAGSMAPSSSASSSSSKPWSSTLNPLNMMPSLGQGQAPEQTIELSTERVVSSIPRSRSSAAPGASPYDAPSACPVKHDSSQPSEEQTEKWEYPSPQQFYNALVRKGWETPEEHVETMVLVHNFLNEQAWLEVLEWEKLAGADASRAELARFQGKPGTLTPKARIFGWLGQIMPNTFNTELPFDRHDWIVRRPDQQGKEVRYVIDYYSVPDDPDKDEPEFVLDVRPALDSIESLSVRLQKGFQEWKQGQGFFTAFAAENQSKPAAATSSA